MTVPNIKGSYPLAGGKIGPAWRDMWQEIRTEGEVDGTHLAEKVGRRHELRASTLLGLLRQARAARLLEVKQMIGMNSFREVGHYRIYDPNRIRWPHMPDGWQTGKLPWGTPKRRTNEEIRDIVAYGD